MLLSRLTPILLLLLLLTSLESESSLILSIILKIMFLKGALFLGTPMAIGSFILGQGVGFLGGGLAGSWSVLKAAHKYHLREGTGVWLGGYGATRPVYKKRRHPLYNLLKKPLTKIKLPTFHRPRRPHPHPHPRPVLKHYGPPLHHQHSAPTPTSTAQIYGGYGYTYNRRQRPAPQPLRGLSYHLHPQFTSHSMNPGSRIVAPPPPPSPPSPAAQGYHGDDEYYLVDAEGGGGAPFTGPGGEELYEEHYPEVEPSPQPSILHQLLALPSLLSGIRVARPPNKPAQEATTAAQNHKPPASPSPSPPTQQEEKEQEQQEQPTKVVIELGDRPQVEDGSLAPNHAPAPISTLVHYIESKLEQQSQDGLDEGERAEAKSLIRLLRSGYLRQLKESMQVVGGGSGEGEVIRSGAGVAGAPTLKTNNTTVESQRPKRDNKHQTRGPGLAESVAELLMLSQVQKEQERGAEGEREESASASQEQHPELPAELVQQLAHLQGEIHQFFTLLTLLDQDSCLQKLVCDVHTRLGSELSEYEANIVVTFRVLNLISHPNAGGGGLDFDADPTSKYRLASVLGQMGNDTRICEQHYAGCVYRVQEIIEMGGSVGREGEPSTEIGPLTSSSEQQEIYVPHTHTTASPQLGVTMPRV